MVKYIVEGVRWFDKTYGNTYHKVYITDVETNSLIYESCITYGYDDQYRTTAMNWLISNKRLSDTARFDHKLKRSLIYFNVSDVARKRDL